MQCLKEKNDQDIFGEGMKMTNCLNWTSSFANKPRASGICYHGKNVLGQAADQPDQLTLRCLSRMADP